MKKISPIILGLLICWAQICAPTVAEAATRIENISGENPTIVDGTVFENISDAGNDGWSYGVAVRNGPPNPVDGPNLEMAIGDNVVFKNNSGVQFGGGAVANRGNMTIGDNVQFIGNKTVSGDNPIKYANGGAIHNEGSVTLGIGNNALFQGNFASRNGGAIYNNEAGEITIGAGAQFIGNSVTQGGVGDLSGGYGGAIANNKPGGKITIGDGAIFSDNKANWWGGAIYNAGQLDFMGDVSFSNNSAVMMGLNDIGNEGTINFNGGNVVLDGGIIGTGNITFNNTALTLNIRAIDDYSIVMADTITLTGDNTLNFILGASDLTGTIDLDDLFVAGTMTGDFTMGDLGNDLYDVTFTDDTFTFAKKPLAAIVDNLDDVTDNQVAVLQAVLFEGDGNAAFNDAADNIAAMLQDTNPDVQSYGLQLVSAMAPTDKPQVQSVSQSNTSQALGAVETRLTGGAAMGRASGDFTIGHNTIWAKGLANQSKLDGAFKSDSFGIAAGIEHNFSTSTKLGLGYAFTNTTVNPNIGESKIDSNTIMAYGEYKPTSWFLNVAASYTLAASDNNMVVRTAKYDSNTFAAQLITGYELNIIHGFEFVPQIGTRYMSVNTEKYADNIGGITDSTTYNFLTGIAGAKLAYDINIGNYVLRPEIYLGATYDFHSDNADAAMVMGNGSVINISGESLDKTGYEIGAGLNFNVSDAIDIALHYVGRFRRDYMDNTGMIDLKYKF